MPPLRCPGRPAGPVRGRFGRPDRLETAPWSPDGSNLVPSSPQNQAFRLRGVLKSRNCTFFEMSSKTCLKHTRNRMKMSPRSSPRWYKTPLAGPSEPQGAPKGAPGLQFLHNFRYTLTSSVTFFLILRRRTLQQSPQKPRSHPQDHKCNENESTSDPKVNFSEKSIRPSASNSALQATFFRSTSLDLLRHGNFLSDPLCYMMIRRRIKKSTDR